MPRKLRLHKRLADDIRAAFDWYEESEEGVGQKWLDAVEQEIAAIERSPETYRKFRRNFRRKFIRKFPYVIIYRCFPGEIYIDLVFHSAQSPKTLSEKLLDLFDD